MTVKIRLSTRATVIAAILIPLAGVMPIFAQAKQTGLKKQTSKAAIVFSVAGQSNAGGCGVMSPEVHKALGQS
jgi:hypothetical protein